MNEILSQSSNSENQCFVRVALPIRHMDLFDYRCESHESVGVGCRVVVPFGRGTRLGIIVEQQHESNIASDKIKPINSVIETEPVVGEDLLRTLQWTSQYYHQSLGEVLWAALPNAVRTGRSLQPNVEMGYCLSEIGRDFDIGNLSRARVQKAIVEILQPATQPVGQALLSNTGKSWRSAIRQLISKQLVEAQPLKSPEYSGHAELIQNLTDAQVVAVEKIVNTLDIYRCFLVHGVTGSGKTEVYLHVIDKVLQNGGQALLLVPEIGLTPQLEQRVNRALGITVSCFHSGMTDIQRHKTWWGARTGAAKVVIGTRSAVFLPFKKLAIIVIDEEHDTSFKQHERVRYHARSVAIHRAATLKVPLVFGTATPSIETIFAAQMGRLEKIDLPARATNIQMPSMKLIDLNRSLLRDGIAIQILTEIEKRLHRREQSLIFINRRGFAPVIICRDCKWIANCVNCDAKLIYHISDQRLHCHHCFARFEMPSQCPDCMSDRVVQLGEGTQRIEQLLRSEILGARVMRIDRDTTQSHAEFERKIQQIHNREVDILIGTQMLSKGHDFPNVTLVCVLNVDAGFYSMDFRATEHMIQQVLQVAGRAGRFEKPGNVYIQTLFPDHEVFSSLLTHDYLSFARRELDQRKLARQPPYSHYALLRANSPQAGKEFDFLNQAHASATSILRRQSCSDIRLFDIVQSPIQKLSNRYRAQLLVSSENPRTLRHFLGIWTPLMEKIPQRGKLRWSLDIDPIDFM